MGSRRPLGDLDAALAAFREASALIRASLRFGKKGTQHLALRAMLAGYLGNAARVAGYADAAYAASQSVRQPNEARARERLHGLLHEEFSADEVLRLLAEGAKMSEDQACRLALDNAVDEWPSLSVNVNGDVRSEKRPHPR